MPWMQRNVETEMENKLLRQRLSAAEKERNEALAWGEKLKEALCYLLADATDFYNESRHADALEQAKAALFLTAPAALSHLRQQVRREALEEVKAIVSNATHWEDLKEWLAEQERQG